MKTLYKILIGVFLATLVFSLSGSLYYANKINTIYEDNVTYVFDDNYKYHLSLILVDDGDIYWQDFKEGAYEAAKVNSCALEMNILGSDDDNMLLYQYLDIAVQSRLDGVIVFGRKTQRQDEAINKLYDQQISVVVVGEENSSGNKSIFVGTNYFEYGREAARLITQIEEIEGEINLSVILSSHETGDEPAAVYQSDIMINGIKNVTDKTNNMNYITTKQGTSNLLGVEDATRQILFEHPEVNVIFCTNPRDTETAARVVVEQNLVGKVFIVGTGVTEAIESDIKKGIIYGSIDRNGYKAGQKSIELICSSDGESIRPDYIDIDIDIYTKMNIDTYKDR